MGGHGIGFNDTPPGKWSILSIFTTILKFVEEKNCVYSIYRLKQNITIMSKSTIWMYLKLINCYVTEIEPKIENFVIFFLPFLIFVLFLLLKLG